MKNNRTLFAVLVVLVVLFSLTHLFRNQNSSTVFQGNLIDFNIPEVNAFHIRKLNPSDTISFVKGNGKWIVTNNSINSKAAEGMVTSLLEELSDLKPDRLVSKKSEKWGKYHLEDSTATVLEVISKHNTTKLFIGKNKASGYHSGSGTAFYVRLENDNHTYLVKSIIPTFINNDINGWRDKTFINSKREEVTKLTFTHPNSAFEVTKVDTIWTIDNLPIDTESVENYLRGISHRQITQFGDDFNPNGEPSYRLEIIRQKEPILIRIKGFKANKRFYMESSLNLNTYFEVDQNEFEGLFVQKEHFSTN